MIYFGRTVASQIKILAHAVETMRTAATIRVVTSGLGRHGNLNRAVVTNHSIQPLVDIFEVNGILL